jgi:hypothetical protein
MIVEESLENNKTKKKKKTLEMNPELSLAVTSETKDRCETFLKSLWADCAKTKSKSTSESGFKFPKLDQGVLWTVNSEGCQHCTVLGQFEDPDAFNPHPNILCCDRDIARRMKAGRALPSSLHGIPFSLSLGYQELFPQESSIKEHRETIKAPLSPVHKDRLELLTDHLRNWRSEYLGELKLISKIPFSHPPLFLPDTAIARIKTRIRFITSSETLLAELNPIITKQGYLTKHLPALYLAIQSSLQLSAHLQSRRKTVSTATPRTTQQATIPQPTTTTLSQTVLLQQTVNPVLDAERNALIARGRATLSWLRV